MVALAVVAMVLLALSIDVFVESIASRISVRAAAVDRSAARLPEWLAPIPVGFLVDSGHVWMRRQKDQLLRLGSDGLAVAVLGMPESVCLLAEPGPIGRGDPLVRLERQGRSLTLRSPLTGTLVAANPSLDAAAVVTDPFGCGWFASLRPSRDDLAPSSRKGQDARTFLASEWEKIRKFVVDHAPARATLGVTMADGGPLQPGFLPSLPVSVCCGLEAAFFAVARPARSDSDAGKEAQR